MIPHILVVDDDKFMLKVISDQISEIGYTCDVASSGLEAVAKMTSDRFHILLTDMEMPKMPGEELVSIFKSKQPEVVCLIMSGIRDINRIVAVLKEHQAYDYLFKPFSIPVLQNALDKAFEIYTLRQKTETFQENERELYKKMYEIFDWKTELRSLKVESIATTVIRQLNIGFLHGGGIGGLLSALSLFFNKAKLKDGKYELEEKLYSMLKSNYESATTMVRSFSKAQNVLMTSTPVQETICVSQILPEIEKIRDELKNMLRLKRQRISISTLPAGSYPDNKIHYDKEIMHSVFNELLLNSMKYSVRNDTIYVLFFLTENQFEIKILNPAYPNPDGTVGVMGKYETMVFEPFYRLSPVADDNYSEKEEFSSGLGLTVVKKIIDLHNANISIYTVKNYSDKERENDVCVTLRFPLIKTNHNEGVKSSQNPGSTKLLGRTG